MIMIDDYHPRNIEIAAVARKFNLQKDFMFFLDFKDMRGAIQQAKDFHAEGFQIGSHTVNHRSLPRIDLAEAKFELEESKKIIENITGKCDWLAYPYGNYNVSVIKMAKDAGYKYARTTLNFDFGNDFETPAMHIGRLHDVKCDGYNSYEIAKRIEIEHYYLHLYDLDKDQEDSAEQFDKFVRWYAERKDRIWRR